MGTFTDDALNRRSGAGYADGTTTSVVYDAAGRLVEASDSVGGTIVNQYDLLDRLIAQTTDLGTVGYQYDGAGRRTRMDAPGQASVVYGYDAASRLTQIVQGSQAVGVEYDTAGRRTRLTLPTGVSTEYQYDAASRLVELIYRNALGVLGNLTYEYDPGGYRTRVGGSFARTLVPDPVSAASCDPANRQLTVGGQTLTYDANGNLTSITDPSGTTTYSWDARNRLASMVGPGLTASFAYDAFGRRVAKEINGELSEYLYDGVDIIEELTDQGSVPYFRSLTIDEPFVRNESEYYLADALGSIIALTDPTGALNTRYTYEPFGQTAVSGPLSSNPSQYTGRENDGPTGLYFLRARYYHPGLHRFISEDPLRLTDQVPLDVLLRGRSSGIILPPDIIRFLEEHNAYSYVRNNPLAYVDPDGQAPVWVVVTATIVVGAIVFREYIYPIYCAITQRCKEPEPVPHIEPVPPEPPYGGRRPPASEWPPIRVPRR